jgi:hypothetical protein
MALGQDGFLGIGIDPAIAKLHIDGGNSTITTLKLTNGTTTEQTATDGTNLTIDATANASLWNYENTYLRFGTNNLEFFRINTNGNFFRKYNTSTYHQQNVGTDSDGDWLEYYATSGKYIQKRISGTFTEQLRMLRVGTSILIGYLDLPTSGVGISNLVFGGADATQTITGNYNHIFSVGGGKITSGNYNNAFGVYAIGGTGGGGTVTGEYNNGFGYQALYALSSGESNSAFGQRAGASITSGSNNVFVGALAGYKLDGSTNTILGANAGSADKSYSGSVLIGHYAGNYGTQGNRLFIDNQNRTDSAGQETSSLITGTFAATVANQSVRVNGDFTYELPHAASFLEDITYDLTLTTKDTYYKITPTFPTTGTNIEVDGITFAGDSLTIIKAGDYFIQFGFSMTSGTNNEEYKWAIFKNGVKQYGQKRTWTTNNVVGGNIVMYLTDLAAGDDISFRMTNLSNNTDVARLSNLNFYIEKKPEN